MHQKTAAGGEEELNEFRSVCDMIGKEMKRPQKIQVRSTSLDLKAVWRPTSPDLQQVQTGRAPVTPIYSS